MVRNGRGYHPLVVQIFMHIFKISRWERHPCAKQQEQDYNEPLYKAIENST